MARTLDSIINSIVTTSGKAYTAYWQLAKHVRGMSGTMDERADVVTSAYGRLRGDTEVSDISVSTIKHIAASFKVWGSALDDARMARMHPLQAYKWRNTAKVDGKYTTDGDTLRTAYDAITGNPPKRDRDADGMVSIKVYAVDRDRLAALADASDCAVADILAAILASATDDATPATDDAPDTTNAPTGKAPRARPAKGATA